MPDVHVLPVNDLREHVESLDCWCAPDYEPKEADADAVIVPQEQASDLFRGME